MTMKMSEIISLSIADVNKKVESLREELFSLNIQKYTSGNEKTHLVKNIKKSIARLLTHQSNISQKQK